MTRWARWRAEGSGEARAQKEREEMRRGQAILGIVLLLSGGVWFLQGVRILPGSFMTGSRFWMVVGIVLAIAGIVLLARSGGAAKPGESTPSR
jgi:hypothetical protein